MEQLKGKVALVTGGSAGIGRAIAFAFAGKGVHVVVADVQAEEGQAAVAQIEQAGGQAAFVRTDVSQADAVENLIASIVDSYGRLDIACNNAGIEGEAAPTAESSEENWDRVIRVNLKGTWLCMKYELAQMVKQGHGAIVNIASVAGLVGYENVPAYAASKHGVVGLTKTAALEYARAGIRVNAICPGVIDTAMIDRFTAGNEQSRQQLAASQPMDRLGKPEEIADAVVWLCSQGASFVTGETIAVDGGYRAR
ncbi:MAG: SDR family oxidoreductase [Chloroflexota bacterium]